MTTTIAHDHHRRVSFAAAAAAAGVIALAGIAYGVQNSSDSQSPPGGTLPQVVHHWNPATTSGGRVMTGE